MSDPIEPAASSKSSTDLTAPDPSVMDQLVSGALGPLSRLQDTIDLTLDEVSDWIMQPYNRQQICNLVTILDAQTQLIICQQRLLAAARLAEVAASAESPETVRRACADLLKIRLIDPYLEDKRPQKMPPSPVYSESEILASLERLGSMDGISSRPTEFSDQRPKRPPMRAQTNPYPSFFSCAQKRRWPCSACQGLIQWISRCSCLPSGSGRIKVIWLGQADDFAVELGDSS